MCLRSCVQKQWHMMYIRTCGVCPRRFTLSKDMALHSCFHIWLLLSYFLWPPYYLRIDIDGVIKVADFGLTEDVYASNYYRKDVSETSNDEKVPIRWMALESIKYDLFTEKTDVVRLYILHFCDSCTGKFLAVVIWSDLLGGVHLWPDTLSWDICSKST